MRMLMTYVLIISKNMGWMKKIIELWGPAPDLKYPFSTIFTSPTACAGQLDQPIHQKMQD